MASHGPWAFIAAGIWFTVLASAMMAGVNWVVTSFRWFRFQVLRCCKPDLSNLGIAKSVFVIRASARIVHKILLASSNFGECSIRLAVDKKQSRCSLYDMAIAFKTKNRFQHFARSFMPDLASRDMTMKAAAIAVARPANNCAPRNLPCIALWMAPPIGGPVKAAKDKVPNAIPSRVPNFVMSGLMLATVDGTSDWNAAEKTP